MHSGKTFKTVIGDIAYDKKGDITRPDYVMYTWKKDADGKITYVENVSAPLGDLERAPSGALFRCVGAQRIGSVRHLRCRCPSFRNRLPFRPDCPF